jgi:hypothetical protein
VQQAQERLIPHLLPALAPGLRVAACHFQVPTSFSSEDNSLEERNAISLGVSGLPCSNQRMMTSINSEEARAGASLS